MGLYGSPDAGNVYTPKGEVPEKKSKKPESNSLFWIVLIVLNILILILVGTDRENTITVILLDCIIVFVKSTISLIYNLVKKNKTQKNIINMILSIIIFFIAVINLGGTESKVSENNSIQNNIKVDAGYIQKQTGTRLSPAKIGDVQQGKVSDSSGLDCTLEVELLDVKKKDEAVKMSKNIYIFAEPREDQEYLFAKFRVKYVKDNSNRDIPFDLNWSYFSYATGDYRKYKNTVGLATGGDLLNSVDLYEGAEHISWICLYVEEDDTQPKAVFLNNLWFDL